MPSNLKLFIFEDFCPDYTSGLAFAIAKDEVEARRLITKELGFDPGDFGDLSIAPLDKQIAKCVCGGG